MKLYGIYERGQMPMTTALSVPKKGNYIPNYTNRLKPLMGRLGRWHFIGTILMAKDQLGKGFVRRSKMRLKNCGRV